MSEVVVVSSLRREASRARLAGSRTRLTVLALLPLLTLGPALLGGAAAAAQDAPPQLPAAGAAPLPTTVAGPASAGTTLTPAAAVALAWQRNAALAAALLEVERAGRAVQAEEGLYSWTLTGDASVGRSTTPSLTADDVTLRSGTSGSLSGGLRRDFASGGRLQLDLTGSLDQQELGGLGVADGDATGYGLSGRLTLTQPLLRGAGTQLGEFSLRQARLSRSATAQQAERVASELLRDLLTDYWSLWYASAALTIQEQARALAEAQLAEVRARIDKGRAAPVEALTFETTLATREEEVAAARDVRRRQALTLLGRLGSPELPPDALLLPGEAPVAVGQVPELATVLTAARSNSFRLRQLDVELQLAREQAGVAGEEQRPKLDLQAWLQGQGLGNDALSPALKQFGRAEAGGAFVGLTFELPLDDRRRRAQQEQALLAVQVAEQNVLAEQRAIEVEAASWVSRLQTAGQRLTLAQRTAELAGRQLAAERRRYEIGTAIALQVQQAEDALRSAQLRVAQARVDQVQAELGLDELGGGLLARWRPARGASPGLD